MTLHIAKGLELPDEAALWTFADLAIKGAGKTYAAGDLAEEMLKNGIPIVVFDPIGTWWGLRVGAENGAPGLPVVVFGGDHQDIPLPTKLEPRSRTQQPDEEKLKLLAKSILESGISAVIDTSSFSKSIQRKVASLLIDELYHLNKHYGVRHVFIEEADFLAPQMARSTDANVNYSLGAVDDLVRRGGNFNLGATLISQRSAVLNKNVLTQCNCLIVLRILHKLDKDAVKTWVESMAQTDSKGLAKWYDSLRDLQNGEAWVWHPETDLFKRVQFRKRETLHATREYFRKERWEQSSVKPIDVEEYVIKFRRFFEPKPGTPQITQRSMVSSPQKQSIRDGQREGAYLVAALSTPSASEGKVHGTSGLSAPPVQSLDEIGIEEKTIRVRVSHSESPISLTTETQEGQAVFVLMEAGSGQELGIKEIFDAASEHGWVIPYDTLRKAVLPRMVAKGFVIGDGHGNYRLPKFVRFDIKEAIPA